MTVKEFGNGFKQEIAEKLADNTLSPERAEKLYPRNKAADKVAGSANLLKQTYVYPNVINYEDGSVIIDSW